MNVKKIIVTTDEKLIPAQKNYESLGFKFVQKRENEYNVLEISSSEWEKYAENDTLYKERAKGNVKPEIEIYRLSYS